MPDSKASMVQLDLVEGTQCYDPGSGTFLAAVQDSQSSVAPSPPQLAVLVTPSGSVPLSVMSLPRAGGSPTARTLDTNNEVLRQIQWLEVPRALHACRHAQSQTAARAFCSAN